MKYLLDTAHVSAALHGRLPVVLKLSKLKPEAVKISALTRVEVEIQGRSQSVAWQKLLREWLHSIETLPFGEAECQQAVRMAAWAPALPASDQYLAATALQHRLCLVCQPLSRFADVTGLEVENWLD